jgi:hypothetical protein
MSRSVNWSDVRRAVISGDQNYAMEMMGRYRIASMMSWNSIQYKAKIEGLPLKMYCGKPPEGCQVRDHVTGEIKKYYLRFCIAKGCTECEKHAVVDGDINDIGDTIEQKGVSQRKILAKFLEQSALEDNYLNVSVGAITLPKSELSN